MENKVLEKKTLKEKLLGNEEINDISIFVLLVLLPLILILGACSIFIRELVFATVCITSLTLLVMAYINHKFFNRTGMTFIYILGACAVMLLNMVK